MNEVLFELRSFFIVGGILVNFTYTREYGRGGTGDMFQIVSLEMDESDVVDEIDQGLHFSDEDELCAYLAQRFQLEKSEIDLDCDG